MTDIEPSTPAGAALVTITASALPTILSADKNDILGRLMSDLGDFKPDGSTDAGRKECGSKARKVSVAKADLIRLADTLKADAAKIVKGVNAEVKVVEIRMDELRDKFLAPVEEYKAGERRRIAEHENCLAFITVAPDYGVQEASADIAGRLKTMLSLPPRDWQEFKARAEDTFATSINRLETILATAERREVEAAELARLRAEAAERDRIAHDEAIASAARVQAERVAAGREAVLKHEAERKERAAADALARAERDRQAAIDAAARAAEKVERDRVAAAEKAERDRVCGHEFALQSISGMIADATSPFNGAELIRHISIMIDNMHEMKRNWEEYADRFEILVEDGRAKIASRLNEAMAHEAERAEAEAKRREQEAAERERTKIEAQRQAEDDECARRKADDDHRGCVNRAAAGAIYTHAAIDHMHIAESVVRAIAMGQIPHITITY